MFIKADSPKWNTKWLFLNHLIPIFCVTCLFYPPLQWIWKPLDIAAFQLCNSFIQDSAFWQNFWAMANHRGADWLEDLIFLFFMIGIVRATKPQDRIKKTAECLFIALYTALIITLVNQALFRQTLHVERSSPSVVLQNFVYLPEKVTWLKVKAKALRSFPGDHATTALFSIIGFGFLARGKKWIQMICISYGIFLTMPRMVTGAHWLTDVLWGSGSIVLIALSWAFCTPFAYHCIEMLQRLLQAICGKTKAPSSSSF